MTGRILVMSVVLLLPLATAAASESSPAGRAELATTAGPLVIHPVEHATMVLQWNGHTVAVDPVGGAEAFAAFPEPGLVLVTHQHGDHLSVETIQGITGEATALIAPPAVAEQLPEAWQGRVTVLRNGEESTWEGIRVAAIPAYNLSPERQRFHPQGRDNGYLLSLGGTRLYISGDTEDIPEMRALENIDAAFVCMNLPYTMDVEAAADAVLEFSPQVVYPYHFRGKDGVSDLDRFRDLVAANPDIDVRVLDWY